MYKYFLIFFLSFIYGCSKKIDNTTSTDLRYNSPLFVKKHNNHTNIKFINKLYETDTLNYFTYPYLYMGGGVSLGDINNDGLDDVFLTGNMAPNKLYLNKGNMVFEDITLKANISGDKRWFTGSTFADVNGDGFLDIYVSVAGQSKNKKFKENQLYINNGDLTFSEQSKKFGLNDSGQSVNATFFDYDNDGDLDVYVANYPITPFQTSTYQYLLYMQHVSDFNTDQLYRNDGNSFVKVTKESGLMQYNLSLSAVTADFNNDGWQDIYVSCDFNSPDCFYINNKDGTFTNNIDSFEHTSFYGMGVDVSDINNDLELDIFQMDMDAASNRRSKANMASMNSKLFEDIKKANFKTQFMQNSLQLRVGADTLGMPIYSEISRLSGVSSTDWSWGPLIADLDNDGFKDFFISNGTRREINNKDYFNKINKYKRHEDSLLIKTLNIPEEPIKNYAFKNNGDLSFKNVTDSWGFTEKTFSNGCAYSDLDNDGDLDLVINNIDDQVSIYENKLSSLSKANYIQFELNDTLVQNKFCLGSRISIYYNGMKQIQELTLTRGFQSSVSNRIHFGLGKYDKKIDSLLIRWPDNTQSKLTNLELNKIHHITKQNQNLHKFKFNKKNSDRNLFNSFVKSPFVYKHKENYYDDFKYEILLPHKTSNFGPGVSVGDLNGDGLDDVYIGAASSYPAGLFYQNLNGSFTQIKSKLLIDDLRFEDMDSVIFDADGDGDNDLYIVSGGNEFPFNSSFLKDRLYINNGNRGLVKSQTSLPNIISSGSRVSTIDFDNDGDLDLFLGGRLVPGNYPYPANSYILENISENGQAKFVDVTESVAPFLNKVGLVTDASIADFNNDGWDDIVLVGEWLPITILLNDKGESFIDVTEDFGMKDSNGWWFSIKSADFDNDGDKDFIVGNLGLNYKYQASENETFDIYFNDFDGNKKNDIVLSYYNEGKKYPLRGRECSSQQIPSIKKKFKDYNSFSTATLDEIYGSKLNKSLHYKINSFASIYLENKGDRFVKHKLNNQLQFSPINQILIDDYNNDGHLDFFTAGNLYSSEVETPRADASFGNVSLGNSKGEFTSLNSVQSGVLIGGDVKDLSQININNNKYIIAVKNDDFVQFLKENDNN